MAGVSAVHEGLALPGGWVVRRVDAARLTLEKDGALLRREVWRRLGVLLVPVVLAAALGGGTWDAEPTVQHIAWPVLGLLVVVAALAVLSVVRAARRAQRGVRLDVDAGAGTAEGWVQGRGLWADFLAPPARLPLSEVKGVEWAAFPGSRPTEPHFLTVGLRLARGRLEGPEGLLAADQLPQRTPAVEALARALGTLAQVPVSRP